MIILLAITVFSLLLHVFPRERGLLVRDDTFGHLMQKLPAECTFVGRYSAFRFSNLPRKSLTIEDVEVVKCEGASLKKEDFGTFAMFPNLAVLDISYCRFVQSDLSEIQNCRSLHVLVLDGCKLTGEGVEALAGTTVEGASILDCQIDDSEILQFRNVSSLRWLVVGDRRLGENVFKKFFGVIRLSETMDCCYDLPKRYL